MIFQLILRNTAESGVDTEIADPTFTNTSIGNFGFKRAKRDGRNPSTGARTSRKYWSTYYWIDGILPLTQGNTEFIY